jgi:hypothetical protein
LDVSASGTNHIRLVAKGETAYFFVNGNYIATLDVSGKLVAADVSVVTGAIEGDQVDGKSTRFEGFTVWSLP